MGLAETDSRWVWRGFPIAYQTQGMEGTPVVLVHGFGASSGHWRKNIPALAAENRVFALDLIGFGSSAKPQPGPLQEGHQVPYTFETWGHQLVDFCREVVQEPVVFVGNSIGCIAAMQAAVQEPAIARGVALLNCSLRMLHERRRDSVPWHQQLSTPIIQSLLSVKPLGEFFFRQVAQPKVIRNILGQAYPRKEAITDELIEIILTPAQDRGAADVFLAFTRYSQGPLPEDLLAVLPCPALMIWGDADPWEPIELGRTLLGQWPAVEKFVALAGVGHCPQDEAPELINPLLQDWLAQNFSPKLQAP